MKLTPYYDTGPIIALDGDPVAVSEPAITQRRRLAEALEALDDDQWTQPSRCDGWSVRDVVVHLGTTNAFWSYSIAAGVRDEPTRLLADFDPVSSPAALVAASAGSSAGEVQESFRESTDALEAVLRSLDEADWTKTAEAPPGHLSVSAVVHHALWDSWIHERDILCPLGIAPAVVDAEVASSLRYVAALNAGLAIAAGASERATLTIECTDPDGSFAVEIGDRAVVHEAVTDADPLLCGDAVELLEALSVRAPLPRVIPQSSSWMVTGLAGVFGSKGTPTG